MRRLTEIGYKTGTDKAIYHGYTELYDTIFSEYTSPRILEIGVASGQSLRMYCEYFKNPYVVGMDIDSWVTVENCKIIRGDQTKVEDLEKCVANEEPFDIILDDGGHTMPQQQITFGYLFKHVKPGGYYILEDIHTSFIDNWLTPSGYTHTTYDMLRKVEQKELGFSNYIDHDTQVAILKRIDSMLFWSRVPDDYTDSATCIMKMK